MKIKAKAVLSIIMILGIFLLPKNVAMAASEDELKILESVNTVRSQYGLEPYALDEEFCKSAQVRAAEQIKCFSHVRPDGQEWYTVHKNVNSENIAHLHSDYQKSLVVEAWMQSKVHKMNVLSQASKNVGIGIIETENGEYYIVMLTD